MNATGGGPALSGTDASAPAPAPAGGGSGATATRAPRLRTVLGLAKAEASLLVRSLLVLAGLLAGGFWLWLYFRQGEPLWWAAPAERLG